MKFYRDGIEEEIDSHPKVYLTREGHVVEEYSVQGDTKFFVTLAGEVYCAHGTSLAQAISDAIWKDATKRPNLESLRNEILEVGKARKISLNEFRLLTGACSEGCRVALKKAKLDGSPMFGVDILKYFPEWGRSLYKVIGWEV